MADAMMLANRPADTAISAGMMDGSSPSISIGNYKGVMLCNRPFAGVQAVAATGGAAKAAFVCGQVPREVGLTKYKNDAVAVKRTKKETALTRHRKWLRDLQNTKDELERGYVLEMQAKEETKKRFMEREAKMRAIVKSSRQEVLLEGGATSPVVSDVNPAEDKDKAGAGSGGGVAFEETKAFGGDGSEAKPETSSEVAPEDAQPKLAMNNNPKLVSKKMPMWAMTEDKAAAAQQEKEDDELEELLSFAQGLDFEKYIDDMEIATMVDQVKKRIAELEATKDDEAFEMEFDENGLPINNPRGERQTLTADRIAALQRRYGVDDAGGGGGGLDKFGGDDDDETRSVARSVLSENRDLGAVHSQRSVAAIAAKKMEVIDEAPATAEAKLNDPRIVTHTDDEGTRMANKNNIQNLPYMNRNPSV